MTDDIVDTTSPTDDLERLYLAFAHILLDHIDEHIREHGMPVHEQKHVEFEGGGILTREHVQRLEFWSFIAPQHEHPSPWDAPEVKVCFDQHWDAMLQAVVQAEDPYLAQRSQSDRIDWCGRILAYPLLLALEATTLPGSTDVSACDDASILTQYRRLRALWQAPEAHFTVTVPLPFFTATMPDGQSVQLGPYYVLTPLLPAEKTRLWQKIDYPTEIDAITRSLMAARSGITVEHLWKVEWCLQAKVSWLRSNTSAQEQMNGEAIAIVMALRLLKPGLFRLPFIYYEPVEGTALHPGTLARNGPEMTLEYWPEQSYALTSDDLPMLQQTIAGVRPAIQPGEPPGLNFALSRFNQAVARIGHEDALIDLAIALECTLLHNQRDELKYRLGLRGAALLAREREPRQTKDILSLLYDARSSIVHDGKRLDDLGKIWRKLPGVQQPREFVSKCQAVVRDVLRTYALHRREGRDLTAVEKILDDNILASLAKQ